MKFKVSELFYSLQGEGKYVGVPSVFLRMFGCNFRCQNFGLDSSRVKEKYNPEVANIIAGGLDQYKSFKDLPLVKTGCDTYASIYPEFKNLSRYYTEQELVTEISNILPNGEWDIGRQGSFINERPLSTHLVITGGEPLLGWQKAYPSLLSILAQQGLYEITFETNGSQMLSKELRDYLADPRFKTTFSVSPKLSISGEDRNEAINPIAVKSYDFPYSNTYLKFVVQDESSISEIEDAVKEYQENGVYCPIYLMPVGGTGELYYENNTKVAKIALSKGWRYSPRLQVDLFKNQWAT